MERSALPLTSWFMAIERLLHERGISATELAAATGITRIGTVRRIARRIREALNSSHATELLAGLDKVFGPGESS
jgi:hypothetical protein